jgi:hypothetical protein
MQKTISIRRLAVLILIVAACLLMIGGGSSANRPTTQKTISPESWTVESVPPETIVKSLVKLTPVSATILADNVLDVTLRNDYDKDVTAVVAAYNRGHIYHREYLFSQIKARQTLAPGATDLFHYEKPPTPGQKVKIIAVVFIDGTSDGDKEEIQWMLDVRRGIRIQLHRMLPYFESLANDLHLASKAFQVTSVRFATLKSVAESLPMESDDGTPLSTALESGLRHGRAFIIKNYVSQLEDALANETVETWYDRLGEKHSVRHSPEENFRMRFEKAHDDFLSLVNKF